MLQDFFNMFFNPWGNVISAGSNDFRKTFGTSKTSFWKPFPMKKEFLMQQSCNKILRIRKIKFSTISKT